MTHQSSEIAKEIRTHFHQVDAELARRETLARRRIERRDAILKIKIASCRQRQKFGAMTAAIGLAFVLLLLNLPPVEMSPLLWAMSVCCIATGLIQWDYAHRKIGKIEQRSLGQRD